MKWNIGCSGFHYKEWKEIFYPHKLPQTKWFEYYCTRFNTLELNNTFYRFPTLKSLQTWYNKSPDDFLFAVKAPRIITHYKQFTSAEEQLENFYNVIRDGLHEKLGPVLFQLPAVYRYSDERLERIIASLDPAFMNVLEMRHESWFNQTVYDVLEQHNIIFSGISHPSLPDDAVVNNSTAYYRFHGVPHLYFSKYTGPQLLAVAGDLFSAKHLKRAFIYFNNTASSAAISNAEYLLTYIREKEPVIS